MLLVFKVSYSNNDVLIDQARIKKKKNFLSYFFFLWEKFSQWKRNNFNYIISEFQNLIEKAGNDSILFLKRDNLKINWKIKPYLDTLTIHELKNYLTFRHFKLCQFINQKLSHIMNLIIIYDMNSDRMQSTSSRSYNFWILQTCFFCFLLLDYHI